MATKPKLMLFSHVCNTRSITGAEKLLLHFMREMGSVFDCVLVVPQEGKLAGLARRFDIQVKVCFLPMLHGVYTPYRGLQRMQNSFVISQITRTWSPLSGRLHLIWC
ncbi:hypothetical protein [Paenibacillus sp. 1A_MP2]|uniref:hypothetical protein n=1 Tax=Paenibacillus sp. 1A_MP2 TaxID=3457495 RepID=UPI003FCE623A